MRWREGPPPRSAIVVVHGFKGFKDWAFFPYVCEKLAVGGHAVVSFNFSHNGIGPADPEEISDLEGFSRNTISRELAELEHVLDLAAHGGLTPTSPRCLGLLGHSRGGAVAILVARDRADLSALVTWGAVSHLDRWSEETLREWREEGVMYVLNQRTGQHLPLSYGMWEDYQLNRDRLDLGGAAEAITSPWLLVHGRDDLTVPMKEGVALARRSEVATLHFIENGGHTFEAVHPFAGSTMALEEALRVTESHFRGHLGSE